MRKGLKKKRRSCGLCKPHKRGLSGRWKAKDEARLIEAERAVAKAVGPWPGARW